MEILECKKKGVSGWKNGTKGKCHIGIEGKQRAIRSQKKKKAKVWADKEKNKSTKK